MSEKLDELQEATRAEIVRMKESGYYGGDINKIATSGHLAQFKQYFVMHRLEREKEDRDKERENQLFSHRIKALEGYGFCQDQAIGVIE